MSNTQTMPGRFHTWTLGDRLRAAREEAGYEVRTFSALTGISPGTITNYEKDRSRPRAPYLRAWSEVTGFDARWLLTGHIPDGGEPVTKSVTYR
ncbi:MAG TPA: helix-turn-helix transcriptional regulator [Ilumatobacteraceae bacterium]|nr:helix-turn-helix transcriptional regulator [Ilumatobacteraceae bacterium]